MRIFVIAKTGAKGEKVEAVDATHFVVTVKAQPVEGKANDAIVKALAKHLGVARSLLSLRSGATGKNKVFDLLE